MMTGGAGFIGANFVLDWLAQCDEPVVNLDKLRCAGNLKSLVSLAGDVRHVPVLGDQAFRARWSTSPLNAMWTVASSAPRTSSRPISSVPEPARSFACLLVGACTSLSSLPSASCNLSSDDVYGALQQAILMIRGWIEFYNQRRPHQALKL